MSAPTRLWLAAQHHKAFLNGGWAWVRTDGSDLTGYAGGERRTTRARMTLQGLVKALEGVTGQVQVHASGPDAAVLAGLLTPPDEPPADDPDLRKVLAPRLAALTLLRIEAAPQTRLAFTQAWADTASERAKARGPFVVAIPRPNLAKAPAK